MSDRTVTVRLRAVISDYQRAMKTAAGESRTFTQAVGANFASLNKNVGELGDAMTRRVTLPLAGIGTAATKVAGDFEATFAQMVGLAGVTADEVAGLREQIMGLSQTTAVGPQQLAEALYFVRSSGIDAAQAMGIVENAAQASAAGMGEVSTIARVATAAVNAYGADQITAARATDILTAAVRNGSFEASELGAEIGTLIPTAAAMGISFEQVGGVLSAMSLTGTNAAEAATSLNAIFSTLLGTSEQGVAMLEEQGLSLQGLRDTAAGPGGLVQVMRQLDRAFGSNEEQLRVIVPNVRAFRGFMNLLAQDGAKVDTVLQNVAVSAGATGEAFGAMQETDQFKIKQGLVDLQLALVSLGATLAPIIAQVLTGVGQIVSGFDMLPDVVQQVVVSLGLLAVAVGPVLRGLSMIAPLFAPVFSALRSQIDLAITSFRVLRLEGVATGSALAVSFGPLAAIMVGLTVVTLGATKIMGDYAKRKEQAAERTRDFVAALKEERDALAQQPGQAEPIVSTALKQIFGDAATGGREFATMLRETGVDMTRFAQMVADGDSGLREWGRTAHEQAGNTDTFMDGLRRAADRGDETAQALLELRTATGFADGEFIKLVRRLGDVDGSLEKASAEVANETHAMRQASDASSDLRTQQANLDIAVSDLGASMSSAASGAGALSGAMVPVADTIAAAAAEIDRMVASVETLFGSTFGVARAQRSFYDAVRDVDAATTSSGGSTRNLERDQRSLERATRDVTDAQEELAEAEEALRVARQGPTAREKSDAALDVRDATLGLKEAQKGVEDARRRLTEERRKGKDGDVKGAQLDLERASIQLKRAQDRLTDAQAAQNKVMTSGAETSDEVKDALEGVEEATERVRDATERQMEAERTLRGEGSTGGPVADRARRISESYDEVIDRGEAWIKQMIEWKVPNDELIGELDDQKQAAQELISAYGDPDGKLAKFIENIERLTRLFADDDFQRNARRIAQTVGVIATPGGQIIDMGGSGDAGGGFAAASEGRARGGMVAAGVTYRVNEDGEELLTIGGKPGYITSRAQLESVLGAQLMSAGGGAVAAGDVLVKLEVDSSGIMPGYDLDRLITRAVATYAKRSGSPSVAGRR